MKDETGMSRKGRYHTAAAENAPPGKQRKNAMSITLETRYADGFLRPHELNALQPQVAAAHEMLHAGTGRERVRTAAAHNAFDLVRRYCAGLAL